MPLVFRRGTPTPAYVLADGEPGWDSENNILKIGDGETQWSALPAIGSSTSSGEPGPQGIQGEPGPQGIQGEPGVPGIARVQVVTGDEARPDAPLVIWLGGETEPTNWIDGDLWFSAAAPVPSTPPVISTTSLSALKVGTSFSQTLVASNSPTSWTITSGSIPGLTLSSSGVLSGTPTSEGPYSLTVSATNADGSDSQIFSGDVAPADVVVGPTTGTSVFSAPPAEPTLATDGTPSITVATGFYISGGTPRNILGMRIYKPVGITVSGTWTAVMYAPASSASPDLATTPTRSKVLTGLNDGWNDVIFDTPFLVENPIWIGYTTDNGMYLNASNALTAQAVQQSDGEDLYLAESVINSSPPSESRHYYRIGSGATTENYVEPYVNVWYGTDVIMEAL